MCQFIIARSRMAGISEPRMIRDLEVKTASKIEGTRFVSLDAKPSTCGRSCTKVGVSTGQCTMLHHYNNKCSLEIETLHKS